MGEEISTNRDLSSAGSGSQQVGLGQDEARHPKLHFVLPHRWQDGRGAVTTAPSQVHSSRKLEREQGWDLNTGTQAWHTAVQTVP